MIHSEKKPLLKGTNFLVKWFTKKKDYQIYTNDHHAIVLKTKALNHLFLMNISQINDDKNSGAKAFESKIIYFTLNKNHIELWEKNPNSTMPNQKIAQFLILEQNDSEIIFDYEKGMTHIFSKRSTYSENIGSNNTTVYKIHESIIFEARNINKDLIIRQRVKIFLPTLNDDQKKHTIYLKYRFSSWIPNPHFVLKKHFNKKKFGFFETHPRNNKQFITKFSINKPITFYYSSNIPKEYKQAVIDGILYWNKAFKDEVIQVKQKTKKMEAFDSLKNIFQWIDKNDRNYAYTSIQTDPMSGEILQSYIHFPSPLNVPSFNLINDLIIEHTKKIRKKYRDKSHKLKIHKFHDAIVTKDNFKQNIHIFTKKLTNINNSADSKYISKKIIEKIFADVIRALVAHEVGHALGIKHNFAGNIGSNINYKKLQHILKNYILFDVIDKSLISTSSTMDYTPFLFSALTGFYIRSNKKALPWDELSIQVAYKDKSENPENSPYYCSDKDKNERLWADCKEFDNLKNPIINAWAKFKESLELNAFKTAKIIHSMDKDKLINMNENELKVELDPRQSIQSIMKNYKNLSFHLGSRIKFLQNKNSYDYQQKSLKLLRRTRGDILLSHLTPKTKIDQTTNSITIPIIKKIIFFIKKYVSNITSIPDKNVFFNKLNLYFQRLEKEIIFQIPNYIKSMQFIVPQYDHIDLEFFFSFSYFLDRLLFLKGTTPIIAPKNVTKNSFTEFFHPKFNYRYGWESIRKKFINLLFHNFYNLENEQSKNELDQIKKDILEKHNLEIKRIIDAFNDNQPLPIELKKFITSEEYIFNRLKN